MYEELIKEFYNKGNGNEAIAMAAYMKNQFPFLGLKKPMRSQLQKNFLKDCKRNKYINWDFIKKCYSLPEREFQYLAVDYLITMKKYIRPDDIDIIEGLITEKSWWDTVDMLAGTIIGDLCSKNAYLISGYILKWAESDNLWLRRSALLFQLKYKDKTDKNLLEYIILKNLNSSEFFINKAIGWILREYSKTDKVWVKEFIQNNKLSPLSRREGSKYLED